MANAPTKANGKNVGHRFQNGHPGYKPKGAGCKITRDLKQGIVDAAIKHGRDGKGSGGLQGFFRYMIKNDLRAFASLMGRVIPLQISGNINGTVGSVIVTPVPAGHYLTEEQVKASMPEVIDITPRVVTIDGDPVEDDNDEVATA
jgi:hypothetical protein